MDARSFFDSAPGFHLLSNADKILAAGWYLHVHRDRELFSREDLRACFRQACIEAPDLSVYLPRMEAKRPPHVLKGRGGYRLDGAVRRKLDAKYGSSPVTIAVSNLLTKLPEQVPNVDEREFLRETLSCYKVKAYRAAIVMAWSLAFNHLCEWVLNDSARLLAFNAAYIGKFPKKNSIVVRTDFDEIKESDIIEVCRAAKFLPKNTATVLGEKLKRRNLAAHPSSVKIEQAQADDAITDLVNNVVLALT